MLALFVALTTGTVLWTTSAAHAHAILMTFIRHEAKVVVGPRNIDISVELTFYEYPSLAERRRMDRDHDETITQAEITDYLASRADVLRDSMALGVDDRPLPVVPLYDPQIDLLGVQNVAPSHHILKLFWFARTPDWLRPGSRIRIETMLWPEAPRIDVLDADGRDGVRVSPDSGNAPSTMPEGTIGPRVISLTCQAVPAMTHDAPLVAASAGRAGAPKRGHLLFGIGAILLLILAAGTAGGVRRYLTRHARTGDRS
jgi:hypothetical protein